MRVSLIGSSYTAFSLAVAAQRTLNGYVESIETAEGKNKLALRGRPGMRIFKDLTSIVGGATPIRGLWSGGGRLFAAAGTKFFEVSSTGTLVGSASTIADDSNHSPADILPNGNQLFVVSAGLSYTDNGAGLVRNTSPALSGQCSTIGKLVLRESTANSGTGNTDSFDVGMIGQTMTINGTGYTVASITNPDMLQLATSAGTQSFKDWSCTPAMTAGRGTFLDGYFIVNRPGSRQFNISNLLDGTTWDGLDFALKEGYPDNLVAVWAEPPLLYVLGTETMEVYRNTGGSATNQFPLERVDGGFARIGLAAPYSPASIFGKLHMLAGGAQGQAIAVRMEGVTPVRISTHAVEEDLARYVFSGGNGVAYAYQDRGHHFWVLNFLDKSWVYDATESARLGEPQWHERQSWDGANFQAYKPWFHTFIPEWGPNGMHIVGDYSSGKLYEMHSDYGDDDGTDIRGVRAMAHLWNGGKRMFMSRFELELETGMASNAPKVWVDWSDDRGQTFHPSPARQLIVGQSGAYSARAFVNRCGMFRDRVPRLTWQGQTRIAFIDANAEIEQGNS